MASLNHLGAVTQFYGCGGAVRDSHVQFNRVDVKSVGVCVLYGSQSQIPQARVPSYFSSDLSHFM